MPLAIVARQGLDLLHSSLDDEAARDAQIFLPNQGFCFLARQPRIQDPDAQVPQAIPHKLPEIINQSLVVVGLHIPVRQIVVPLIADWNGRNEVVAGFGPSRPCS